MNNDDNLSGVYIFISFDLVNATEYKLRHINWSEKFRRFYRFISNKIKAEDSPLNKAKTWKLIGDEILFYYKIDSESPLKEIVSHIAKTAEEAEVEISEDSQYFDKLSIKSTVWIAEVEDYSKRDKNSRVQNIIFRTDVEDLNTLDFLGSEIDLGFRISSASHKGVVGVDAKLAYLIYDKDKDYAEKHLKIVDFQQLKGIWRGHPYPIVWFHPYEWSKNIFSYYELLENKKVKEFKTNIENKDFKKISEIESILADINQKISIEKIFGNGENTKQSITREEIKNNPTLYPDRTTLNLSGLELKKLPEDISDLLKELVYLDLSDNKSKIDISNDIENLEKLEVLIMDNNLSKELFNKIGELKSLKSLYLVGNQQSELNNSLQTVNGFENLERVKIGDVIINRKDKEASTKFLERAFEGS